jgi:cytochrome c oxidase subunit 2
MSRTHRSWARIALVVVAALGVAPAKGRTEGPEPRVVHIVAERFSFTPSEITVDEGASVELRITSEDTAHGFRLVGPGDFDVVIPKRGRGDVRIRFDASVPGRYAFECSRVCGAGHSFMRGTLRVRAAADSR